MIRHYRRPSSMSGLPSALRELQAQGKITDETVMNNVHDREKSDDRDVKMWSEERSTKGLLSLYDSQGHRKKSNFSSILTARARTRPCFLCKASRGTRLWRTTFRWETPLSFEGIEVEARLIAAHDLHEHVLAQEGGEDQPAEAEHENDCHEQSSSDALQNLEL